MLATYEALGGVVGALERRADELLDALDEREARQARRLFVNLVAVTDTHTLDTRRRVALRDLRAREPGAEDAFDQVVARFVDARLLVRGEERDEPIVEVAHEALLRRWTRLRGWLMEDRDKLAALREVESWAAPWPKHKPLLAGDQLAIAVSVRDRYPHDVSAKVHEMVDASARAEEARARRQRRRGRVVLLSIAAFAVMMAASTALIYRWYRNAQEPERAEGVARGRAGSPARTPSTRSTSGPRACSPRTRPRWRRGCARSSAPPSCAAGWRWPTTRCSSRSRARS